jgi:hypothetical protein
MVYEPFEAEASQIIEEEEGTKKFKKIPRGKCNFTRVKYPGYVTLATIIQTSRT